MKLTESILRKMIKETHDEMSHEEAAHEYGKSLGFQYDEGSDIKASNIAKQFIDAINELRANPKLAMNVENLIRSEGEKQLAGIIGQLSKFKSA